MGAKPRRASRLDRSAIQLALPREGSDNLVEFRPPGQVNQASPTAIAVPLLRSSVPRAASGIAANTVDIQLGNIASVDPLVPAYAIRTLVTLSVASEPISNGVKTTVANANTGHDIVVDVPAESSGLAARTEAELELFRQNAYPRGGMEGLIGTALTQAVVTGAISMESVIASHRRGVERVVIVPAADIEFYGTGPGGEFEPYQRHGRGLAKLDPRTYSYIPWRTIEANPYGIPPMIAAINAVIRQRHMLDQLDLILEKIGWLGLLTMNIPLRDGIDNDRTQSADELTRRRQAYLQQLGSNLQVNARRGIMLLDEKMTLKYDAAPSSTAAGARELLDANDVLLCQGMGIDPALLGYTFAKTETWRDEARRQFQDLTGGVARLAADALTKAVRLHLMLAGVPASCWVEFRTPPSSKPLEEAQAEQIRQANAFERGTKGLISPDTVAKELGYDSFENPELLFRGPASPFGAFGFKRRKDAGLRFRFDARRNKYVQHRPTIELVTLAPKAKRAKFATVPQDAQLQRILDRFLDRYAGRIAPVADELQSRLMSDLKASIRAHSGSWADPDEFGRWALNEMQTSFGTHWREFGADAVLEKITPVHEEAAKAWSNEDRSIWAGKDAPKVDGESLKASDISALAGSDAHHMSIYLEGMSSAERAHLQKLVSEEFDQAGRDVTDPDVLDEMLTRMERSGGLLMRRRDHGREGGEASETDAEARERMGSRLQRIADTSLMRSRNVTAARVMQAAAVDEMELVAVGSGTCKTCMGVAGTRKSVEATNRYLDSFLAMSPEEQEAELTAQRRRDGSELAGDDSGAVQLPLHPSCRCRWEAVL